MAKDARGMTRNDWTDLAKAISEASREHKQEIDAELEDLYPGWMDQADAATMDMRQHVRTWAAMQGPERVRWEPGPERFLDILYGQFLRLATGLADGRTRHCKHVNPELTVPSVALIFWDRIDCRNCAGKFGRPQLSQIEEFTCDLCRKYIADGCLHPVMVQFGPVVLVASACHDCRGGREAAHGIDRKERV